MAARDIRRESGDVAANRFINPGVVDNSTAQAIEGIGKASLELDKTLALERFGEATETLRSQYMVGDVASENIRQETIGDAVDADQDTDDDEPSVSVGEDNHALKDFSETLDKFSRGRAQGVMSYDMFRMRAERLYRTAIMRRPGLAQEFRQQAGSILGFDVVGSAIDVRREAEAALLAAQGKSAKSKEDLAITQEKDRRQLLEKLGFTFQNSIDLGSPEFAKQWVNNLEAINGRIQTQAQLTAAKQGAEMVEASNARNSGIDSQQFVAQANTITSGIYTSIQAMQGQLAQAGLENDPDAVQRLTQQGLAQFDQAVANLEASAAGKGIPDDVRSRTFSRLSDLRGYVQGVMSKKDSADFTTNAAATMTGVQKLSLLNDEEFRTTSVLLREMGDAAPLMADAMDKRLMIMGARMYQDQSDANAVTQDAASMVRPLIGKVFSRGPGQEADPRAVAATAKLLDKGAQSFYMVDDSAFRMENFIGSAAKAGFVQELNMQLKTLDKQMTDEQKLDLGMSLSAAAANAVRVMGAGLYAQAPGLKGKVEFDFSPEPGKVYKLKAGQEASPQEALVLAKFNRAFNTQVLENVIGKLTDQSREDVWATIRSSYSSVQDARKTAQKARSAPSASGQGGGGSSGLRGASSRWWDE